MSAIVLFDGVCNFCDHSVNFIIGHDRERYFKFAPLQSEPGSELSRRYGFRNAVEERPDGSADDLVPLDSIVLIENGTVYTHSSAALRIAKHLDGAYFLLYALWLIPRPVRDLFYRLFARYRYRFFGRKDACMMPTPEIRERFLV